jgi:hypothetical protein
VNPSLGYGATFDAHCLFPLLALSTACVGVAAAGWRHNAAFTTERPLLRLASLEAALDREGMLRLTSLAEVSRNLAVQKLVDTVNNKSAHALLRDRHAANDALYHLHGGSSVRGLTLVQSGVLSGFEDRGHDPGKCGISRTVLPLELAPNVEYFATGLIATAEYEIDPRSAHSPGPAIDAAVGMLHLELAILPDLNVPLFAIPNCDTMEGSV